MCNVVLATKCNPECKSHELEFCGSDDRCHPHSCENWYNYGDKKYTRHKNITSPTLECQSISPSVSDSYNYHALSGVFYGCNVTTGTSVSYTRECVAEFDKYTNFTCHEMSLDRINIGTGAANNSTVSAQFQEFIDNNNIENVTCLHGDPKYLYVNWVGFDTHVGESHIWTLSISSEFNETLAMRTMYAALVSNQTDVVGNQNEVEDDDINYSGQSQPIMDIFLWSTILVTLFALC